MESRTPEMLLDQGRTAKRKQRTADARGLFQQGLENNTEPELEAVLCEELGYVERSLRDLKASKEHYLRSSQIYRRLGNRLKTAHTVRHAADILRELKKPEQAAPLYLEAIEIYRRHDDALPLDLANALRGFALLKEDIGDRAQAVSLWQEAGELYQQVGIAAGVSESAARIQSLRK